MKVSDIGFEIKGQESKMYKLQLPIYGYKQLSKQWYLKFHKTMISYYFYMSLTLFTRKDSRMLVDTKEWLSLNFEMMNQICTWSPSSEEQFKEASWVVSNKLLESPKTFQKRKYTLVKIMTYLTFDHCPKTNIEKKG